MAGYSADGGDTKDKITDSEKPKLGKVWKHSCGCKLRKDGDAWVRYVWCDIHQPNYAKRADKAIHNREKLKNRDFNHGKTCR